MTPQQISRLRADTAATKTRIHLDNAGASLMPAPVIDAISSHQRLEAEVGGYVAAERQAESLENAYAALATFLKVPLADVAFTPSATDAWDRLFYSMDFAKGDRVVTGFNEYCANFVALLDMKAKRGIEIIVVPEDGEGNLDLARLEAALKKKTALLCLSHVTATGGYVTPVKAAGKLARANGVPFLLDASQSVGCMPVHPKEIGCDMLTGTAGKYLRGPRGVGFMYLSKRMRQELSPVFVTDMGGAWTGDSEFSLRSDTRVFETWERSTVNQIGFGAALEYASRLDMKEVYKRVQRLATHARQAIGGLQYIEVLDRGAELGGIVTLSCNGLDSRVIKQRLEDENVAAQVSLAEYTRLDLVPRGVAHAVRLSPHYFNTHAEINKAAKTMARVCEDD